MVTDSLKTIIREDETSEWYMLGQADRPMGCPCDDCKNARVKYEASGLMIRFVNAVNAEIQSWIKSENLNRNIKFCLFAYDYTERAPLDSKGEILDAIHAPAGARDVDGVKRRTRAGMGRCQGGFCGSKVVELLARELGVEINEITKFGGESKILYDRTK